MRCIASSGHIICQCVLPKSLLCIRKLLAEHWHAINLSGSITGHSCMLLVIGPEQACRIPESMLHIRQLLAQQ